MLIIKNEIYSLLNKKIKEFKRLINFYGSIGARDLLLDEIMKRVGINKNSKDIYLSLDEIKEISDMGFEIGSYVVSHIPNQIK